MFRFFYFLFTVFLRFSYGNEDLRLDYLEKLVENALERSKTYGNPVNNGHFFKNYNDTIEILEYGTFDFIVVGAGSSGSIVASRLSEIEKWKILLLEAGDMDDDLTDIPYLWQLLQFSERNWGYCTVPQKNAAFGYRNQEMPYQRGKILGGSGTINGLGFMRGNKGDYDKWESLGNPEWSFKNLLPYFKKMENFESEDLDPNYRGFGGPLNVYYQLPKDNLSFFFDAAQDLGLKIIEDFNAGEQMGISRAQRSINKGKRVTGGTAYVKPSMNRVNFNLTLNALVTKLSINRTTKTVDGVIFIKDGKKYVARASKEVIVSGGSINTPQLLMLSGIGPCAELKKHKIKTIANLPVGKRALDHYELKVFFRSNSSIQTESFRNLLRQYLHGKGVLTNIGNSKTYSYIHTRDPTASIPNLEMISYFKDPVPITIPGDTNYKPEVQDYFKTINQQTDIGIDLYIMHPKSYGSVKLKSDNPMDFPLIDPGVFSNEDDAHVFLEGIRFLDKFEKTPTAQKLNLTKVKISFCDQHTEGSDDYWLCFIKSLTAHGGHLSSTAKMGPRTDPFAVVDQELRVHGIKKLRVADCSIMPTHISGHTNSIAFAIGEKAADIIKKAYGM